MALKILVKLKDGRYKPVTVYNYSQKFVDWFNINLANGTFVDYDILPSKIE